MVASGHKPVVTAIPSLNVIIVEGDQMTGVWEIQLNTPGAEKVWKLSSFIEHRK